MAFLLNDILNNNSVINMNSESFNIEKDKEIILSNTIEEEIDEANSIDITNTTENVNHSEQNHYSDYIMVVILFIINLLNYMDRFTIPSVLDDIKKFYGDVDDTLAGLLQTSFICSYMILSPVFGFLGDRYSRKYLMAFGILFWSGITFASSFIPGGKQNFWWFLFMRALVGIGEASYSTVAPTLLADLFKNDSRSKVLAIFYFAIPVGSGLGYIIGGQIARLFNVWQAALRVTPICGVICLICLMLFIREPKRGTAEGGTHLHNTSWLADIKSLLRNRSFMTSTFGFTAVAYVTGALAFWAPTFIHNAVNSNPSTESTLKLSDVSLIFGIVTVAAGIIGVAIGSESARRLRPRFGNSDPLVCAAGLLLCCPFLYASLIVSRFNTIATFILIFLGETLLCLNWSLVADITLSVVLPTRRATASALQILISHLFGDAGSPWIVGQISDVIMSYRAHPDSAVSHFIGLQYGLFSTVFLCAIGGGCFLACANTVIRDRSRIDKIILASQKQFLEDGVSLTPESSQEVGQRRNSTDMEAAVI